MIKKHNSIVALCIISESEIAKVIPDFDYRMPEEKPEEFFKFLFSLGMDISAPVERQDGLKHRNRLNEIVICSRYVGNERLDYEWLNSGYASQEAKDKASGSRLLEDVYRAKNMTEDRQIAIASREHYEPQQED